MKYGSIQGGDMAQKSKPKSEEKIVIKSKAKSVEKSVTKEKVIPGEKPSSKVPV